MLVSTAVTDMWQSVVNMAVFTLQDKLDQKWSDFFPDCMNSTHQMHSHLLHYYSGLFAFGPKRDPGFTGYRCDIWRTPRSDPKSIRYQNDNLHSCAQESQTELDVTLVCSMNFVWTWYQIGSKTCFTLSNVKLQIEQWCNSVNRLRSRLLKTAGTKLKVHNCICILVCSSISGSKRLKPVPAWQCPCAQSELSWRHVLPALNPSYHLSD